MKNNLAQLELINRFWHHLSHRRQRQFWLLLVLMVIAMFTEVVSVGAIIPFLGALTAPELVYGYEFMQPIIYLFELTEPNQLLLPLSLFFITAALVAGIVRLTLLYGLTRLSFATGHEISINIYRRTLYQNYEIHIERNSSEVINGIINKTNIVVYNMLMPILTLISSMVLLIGVMVLLLTIDVVIAIATFGGFGLIYWGIIRFTSGHLERNSEVIARESTKVIKSLQEGLGGIRDVLINGSQEFYCQIYRNADLPLRRAQGDNLFISGSPRYLMEGLGMILIASLAYIMSQRDGGIVTVIPVLGALALGAQRLLPAMQQAYSSVSAVKGAQASLQDVLDLLDQPVKHDVENSTLSPITFLEQISLNNLSFRYTNNTPWVLKNINFNLTKGDRIGFMGKTGSGKSTLLDIVMGLLPPSEGVIRIDNQLITNKNLRSWQSHIAHVPQNIYLSDGTIEENIAFGLPKECIDHQLVSEAASQAQIADLIESLPEQYQSFVGERGAKLSGGQRQRIGIARALYKQADVIIFDEATSALDESTESAVMEAIEGLGRELTILIIAHRLTTLKGCDQIFELDNGDILRQGKYNELVASKS